MDDWGSSSPWADDTNDLNEDTLSTPTKSTVKRDDLWNDFETSESQQEGVGVDDDGFGAWADAGGGGGDGASTGGEFVDAFPDWNDSTTAADVPAVMDSGPAKTAIESPEMKPSVVPVEKLEANPSSATQLWKEVKLKPSISGIAAEKDAWGSTDVWNNLQDVSGHRDVDEKSESSDDGINENGYMAFQGGPDDDEEELETSRKHPNSDKVEGPGSTLEAKEKEEQPSGGEDGQQQVEEKSEELATVDGLAQAIPRAQSKSADTAGDSDVLRSKGFDTVRESIEKADEPKVDDSNQNHDTSTIAKPIIEANQPKNESHHLSKTEEVLEPKVISSVPASANADEEDEFGEFGDFADGENDAGIQDPVAELEEQDPSTPRRSNEDPPPLPPPPHATPASNFSHSRAASMQFNSSPQSSAAHSRPQSVQYIVTPLAPSTIEVDTDPLATLFPLVARSEKDLPKIEEIISTTSARKTWYRLTQQQTARQQNYANDYIRVKWSGSQIQTKIHKIVERWITEDKMSGGTILGGSRDSGGMFGWGDGMEHHPTSPTTPKRQTTSVAKAMHQRTSSISKPSPFSIASPQTPTSPVYNSKPNMFGWGEEASPSPVNFEWSANPTSDYSPESKSHKPSRVSILAHGPRIPAIPLPTSPSIRSPTSSILKPPPSPPILNHIKASNPPFSPSIAKHTRTTSIQDASPRTMTRDKRFSLNMAKSSNAFDFSKFDVNREAPVSEPNSQTLFEAPALDDDFGDFAGTDEPPEEAWNKPVQLSNGLSNNIPLSSNVVLKGGNDTREPFAVFEPAVASANNAVAEGFDDFAGLPSARVPSPVIKVEVTDISKSTAIQFHASQLVASHAIANLANANKPTASLPKIVSSSAAPIFDTITSPKAEQNADDDTWGSFAAFENPTDNFANAVNTTQVDDFDDFAPLAVSAPSRARNVSFDDFVPQAVSTPPVARGLTFDDFSLHTEDVPIKANGISFDDILQSTRRNHSTPMSSSLPPKNATSSPTLQNSAADDTWGSFAAFESPNVQNTALKADDTWGSFTAFEAPPTKNNNNGHSGGSSKEDWNMFESKLPFSAPGRFPSALVSSSDTSLAALSPAFANHLSINSGPLPPLATTHTSPNEADDEWGEMIDSPNVEEAPAPAKNEFDVLASTSFSSRKAPEPPTIGSNGAQWQKSNKNTLSNLPLVPKPALNHMRSAIQGQRSTSSPVTQSPLREVFSSKDLDFFTSSSINTKGGESPRIPSPMQNSGVSSPPIEKTSRPLSMPLAPFDFSSPPPPGRFTTTPIRATSTARSSISDNAWDAADFSFFDAPSKSGTSTPQLSKLNAGVLAMPSHSRTSSTTSLSPSAKPAPTKTRKDIENEDEQMIEKLIDGLPDLSYMLR